MTRSINGTVIPDTRFCFPFRMILAGSSESGKTRFAGSLLKRNDIFMENPKSVTYYYPCYLEQAPVNWHNTLSIPVNYQIGLPTKEDLTKLPKRSCVVIDDSYDSAIKSSAVDHLFRVISGKKQISVIIMTQNNFSKGKYGREIRNSCNFAVLFRNCCDASINENVARMAGLKKAYDAASLDLEGQMYPHMVLDQSQKGQLSPFRLFTNIFDEYKIAYSVHGMKGYVIGAPDFKSVYNVIEDAKTFKAKLKEINYETEINSVQEKPTNVPIEIGCPSESDEECSGAPAAESNTTQTETTAATTTPCASGEIAKQSTGESGTKRIVPNSPTRSTESSKKRIRRWKQQTIRRALYKNK